MEWKKNQITKNTFYSAGYFAGLQSQVLSSFPATTCSHLAISFHTTQAI